ncbi:MAG: 50S ribosomal protein L24 [Elusimicrobia bacterium]|nr:50S ribosomal protein L24 [Elusimicrobiota bacterium]
MFKLKKKDMVLVISGKDKGKKGEVKEVMPEKQRVVVVGVNIVSKHRRPSKDKPGGIHKIESSLHVSNVQLICPKCNKPRRIRMKKMETGDKMRVCAKCGETIL